MTNKTISINPSLFSIGGSKTRKNREKKSKQTVVPLISPNVLKNKLLKRIKEHKQKETQGLENNKRNLVSIDTEILKPNNKHNNFDGGKSDFNDEFSDSIQYLQTLSKQKKINEEKAQYDLIKQKKREELERRTLRNHSSIIIPQKISSYSGINLDLPDELQQPFIPINSETMKLNNNIVRDDVPYGILKGGLKPSYREWNRTQRNNIVTNPQASLIIQGGPLNQQKTARENRLNLLKEKLKQKQRQLEEDATKNKMLSENLIRKPNPSTDILSSSPTLLSSPLSSNLEVYQSIENKENMIEKNVPNFDNKRPIIAKKHITKKTIKRKYTLGRSNIKRTVSVLIKDRGTRKKVLHAQKDLKRRNINEIKTYLRDHNLIKAGSNAPNDVLRKLYESAMLAGEITNSNVETLLHNFTKEDKQL